jgi:hypothetical protein
MSSISGKGRSALWGRISLLLHMHKNDCQYNILHGMLLAPARNGAHWHKYVHICGNDTMRAWCKKHRMEHKLFEIFDALNCCGFKS